MRRIIAILFLTVFIGVFATGCGNSAGSEFIGKWVNTEMVSRSCEIKRNGESFILANTAPDLWQGGMKTTEYPAVFKDGVLTISGALAPVNISYVKDGDYLIFGGQKYTRQK